MTTVRVEQPHTLSTDEAIEGVNQFAKDLTKWGMSLSWNGMKGDLKGTGASGNVSVLADKVVVEVKLGVLAKMAGVDPKRLQGSIEKRLRAVLTASEDGG